MNRLLLTLGQFFRRDFYMLKRRLGDFIFNYGLLYPVLYVVCFGYMIPIVSGQTHQTTLLFVGSIVLLIQVVAYVINIDFFFDLEKDRFVEYQLSMLSGTLVLFERIAFSALLCFILVLPFFPISMFLLGSRIDFSHTSWPLLAMHLFVSALFATSLNVFGLCFIQHSRQLGNLWTRLFRPMFMLGGFQVPRAAMARVSPVIDFLTYINPMVYVSEGIRSIVIGGPDFIDYSICAVVLVIASLVFMNLAFYYFKKRIDYV